MNKRLRERLGRRSIQLRKGDSVKVLRGSKRGSEGKITEIDYKKGVVFIEKLVRKKADGTEIQVPVKTSNLLVLDVDESDARRFKGKKVKKNLEREGRSSDKKDGTKRGENSAGKKISGD